MSESELRRLARQSLHGETDLERAMAISILLEMALRSAVDETPAPTLRLVTTPTTQEEAP